jgi:hypothetical protein
MRSSDMKRSPQSIQRDYYAQSPAIQLELYAILMQEKPRFWGFFRRLGRGKDDG